MNAGIVVIGRNEGPRLVRCLDSVRKTGFPVVYVDSGSDDASVEAATEMHVDAVALSPPFTAARARNHGFGLLLQRHPELQVMQFVDGDCTLIDGWLQAAIQGFREEPRRAVVFGHLRERNREATPYNRLCDLEWRSPPGDFVEGALGGVFAVRVSVFQIVGGFRPDMVAGEDSELGVRIRLAGHAIIKLDRVMADHDADIRSFAQWWKRAVRAGHAIGQRHEVQGASAARDCVRELRSTVFWGIVLPLMAVLGAPFSRGLSLLLLLAYPALLLRVRGARLRMGDPPGDALLYALFLVIGKFANAVGLAKFAIAKRSRDFAIIEYK